jgi:8-oxo-dGTP pyrophosphatase MutT (NUDIX family)
MKASSRAWLGRADLRARLAAPRAPKDRSDEVTTRRLLAAGNLAPFDQEKYPTAMMREAANLAALQANTPPVPAAVLVPLVERRDGFSVLLTQRTADLKAHAGQISFPGGRLEEHDIDAAAGALRETYEEIGLPARHIEILGMLDAYRTVTGFEVTPVVGAVTPPFDLKPDPMEVADVFEVPLAFLLDPANHQHHSRVVGEADGRAVTRAFYAIPYGDRYIWGATAGMLINLYEVLTAA